MAGVRYRAPDSYEAWNRASLPAPNFYCQNRTNGHGHLGYPLATPLGLVGRSRKAPIVLAADVQRGMTKRLGADRAYPNRLAKNPHSARWRTSWFASQPYELGNLLGALDPRDLKKTASRCDVAGLGRDCELFNDLRHYAYANVLAFKQTGRGPDRNCGHTAAER
jgi:Replicase family